MPEGMEERMKTIRLIQEFEEPITGYWDGGSKSRFEWTIDHIRTGRDSKGIFVRVGSWSANNFFNVAQGKTDKQTLGNARRRLARLAKKAGKKCSFRYIDE